MSAKTRPQTSMLINKFKLMPIVNETTGDKLNRRENEINNNCFLFILTHYFNLKL